MKKIMNKTKLVTALSVSLISSSMATSANGCNNIRTEANKLIESKAVEINNNLKAEGFENIDIRNNTKFKEMKSKLDAEVSVKINECHQAVKAAEKAAKKERDRAIATFLLNPLGETIYLVTHAAILDPLGAGGAKNDLNQAVHRAMNPVALAVAVGKELDRTKENLGKFESEIRNGLSGFESSIRHEMARVESSVRNEMARVESSVRNEMARTESRVRNEIRRWF